MTNKKNKKKKKKGFTLIELVIVLAVLAIIALIAIPNFTKVRNDSLEKADARTGEQIKKITLMAIANEDIKLPTVATDFKLKLDFNNDAIIVTTGSSPTGSSFKKGDYEIMLKEVNAPQVNGKIGYEVHVDKEGNVRVYYNGGTETLTE